MNNDDDKYTGAGCLLIIIVFILIAILVYIYTSTRTENNINAHICKQLYSYDTNKFIGCSQKGIEENIKLIKDISNAK